jgi:hypothetical protein
MASARRGVEPTGQWASNLATSSSVHAIALHPLTPLLDGPAEHLAQLGDAPVGGGGLVLLPVPEQTDVVGGELGDRAVSELEFGAGLGRLIEDRAHDHDAQPLLVRVGAREFVRVLVLVGKPT